MRTLRLLKLDAWRAAPPPHPHPLHAWLTSRGSLTSRIKAHVSNFNLVRLKQLAQLPNRDEQRGLGLRHGELAIVREVLLRDADRVLVFAHSVAARRDVRGVWRGLSRLGTRPLAEMLFHDPTVVRLPMEYRKIDARHPLYRRAQQVAPFDVCAVWARRSVFLKHGRPLLVTEVFLTTLLAQHREKRRQNINL
ncbi:MAG: chorismate lyase [Usitatibacteraceae bacterium]